MGNLLSIVISNNRIKIAELSCGKKGIGAGRLIEKEVPEGMVKNGTILDVKGFSKYLTDLCGRFHIKTKRVVFSLLSDKIMTKEVLLPKLDKEKLKSAMKVNAFEYFPIDLSGYVLSYLPISEVRRDEKRGTGEKPQLRLMVVAAPNEMVQSYYDAAKLSHLKIEGMDYIGNSVFQLTAGQFGDEPNLVIWPDREHIILTIYNGGIMVLQRSVDLSGALTAGNPDYLMESIKRVIEYYRGRNAEYPLERIYVIGDSSEMPELNSLLENRLNLPVEPVTDLKRVFVNENTGLSMTEVLKYMDNIGAVIAPVNFVPRQLEQDIKRRLEAKACHVMILLALFAALAIITVPATEYLTEAIDTMELKNKLLASEDVGPIQRDYTRAQIHYGDVEKVESFGRMDNRGLRSFIDTFEQLRPGNMSIGTFSCMDTEMSFTALAGSKKIVAKLIQQLNTITGVSEVVVSGLSSSFFGEQETVSFSVTCKLMKEGFLLKAPSESDSEAAE